MKVAWLVVMVFAAGCAAKQPTPTGPCASEPPLAEQAEAVRAGRSEQVRLDKTLVRDEDLAMLDGLEDKLRRVNFSRTELTDRGLELLSHFEGLEQLRFASPKITDDGLQSVAKLKKLRFLHLLNAPIGDAGLDHLHGISTLESVYLDRTKVTDDGIARLLKALPNVHLHIDEHHHPLDAHGKKHEH